MKRYRPQNGPLRCSHRLSDICDRPLSTVVIMFGIEIIRSPRSIIIQASERKKKKKKRNRSIACRRYVTTNFKFTAAFRPFNSLTALFPMPLPSYHLARGPVCRMGASLNWRTENRTAPAVAKMLTC